MKAHRSFLLFCIGAGTFLSLQGTTVSTTTDLQRANHLEQVTNHHHHEETVAASQATKKVINRTAVVSPRTEKEQGTKILPTNYMLRLAILLRREANRATTPTTTTTSSTRHGYRLHFYTYATPSMNLTVERILSQARRSEFFLTSTALSLSDLPNEFLSTYKDILDDPHGGGNYLWRYPVWQLIQQTVPQGDYVLFLDAGCSILSTGVETLRNWIQELESSSEEKRIMRFPQATGQTNREVRWTTNAIFDSFHVSVDTWPGAMQVQYFGGILLCQNGAAWRHMLALIYETLAPNPYIITDRYNAETKKKRPGRFVESRHDQSVSSVASKVLNNFVRGPQLGNTTRLPFGVSRFRSIAKEQLDIWLSVCKNAPRAKDEHCDELAETTFELNSEVLQL